jgi:hypothetical protein
MLLLYGQLQDGEAPRKATGALVEDTAVFELGSGLRGCVNCSVLRCMLLDGHCIGRLAV